MFTIPDIIQDLHRAVRFIRYNAANYGINRGRLGIMGISSGGHLALMVATQGTPGRAEAKDPVDRESSSVQAVACFFPPTDFLNWGAPGVDGVGLASIVGGFRQAGSTGRCSVGAAGRPAGERSWVGRLLGRQRGRRTLYRMV